MSDEKIATFLYLLMRDHLPAGTVCKIINDVNDAHFGVKIDYTNLHLVAMAKDYVERLEG